MSRKSKILFGTDDFLTKGQRKAAERQIKDEAMIEAAVNATPEDVVASTQVGKKTLVTDAQLAAVDVSKPPKKPCINGIRKKVGNVTVEMIYPADDYAYLKAGWYCPRCEELQREQALPEWAISATPKLCENPKGRGCGWPKGYQYVEPFLPWKITRL